MENSFEQGFALLSGGRDDEMEASDSNHIDFNAGWAAVGGDDGPGKGKDPEDEIRETKDERSDAKMKNASATGQAKSIWSGHASRSQDEGDRKRFMAYVRSCRGQDDGANKVRDAFQDSQMRGITFMDCGMDIKSTDPA